MTKTLQTEHSDTLSGLLSLSFKLSVSFYPETPQEMFSHDI